MEVSRYKCDICSKPADSENYDRPKGWYIVGCEGEYKKGDFWLNNKDVCPDCAKASGLALLCEGWADLHV